MKKIVLKVPVMCEKCKICIMRIVSEFSGITSMAVDADKDTLTVVGTVDAVLIVKALRKAKKMASVQSIGPADNKEEKKDEKDKCKELPACCKSCTPMAWYELEPYPSNACTVL